MTRTVFLLALFLLAMLACGIVAAFGRAGATAPTQERPYVTERMLQTLGQ